MKKIILICVLAVVCSATVLGGFIIYNSANRERMNAINQEMIAQQEERARGVLINEVSIFNAGFVQDRFGAYSDYIELFNPSSQSAALTGLYLSNDRLNLWKNSLSGVSIPANGHVVFFADGLSRVMEPTSLNFTISAGDTIFLSYMGRLIDSVTIPELSFGQVYGRNIEGLFQVMAPSPGASNGHLYYVTPPVLSVASGFFDEPFFLTITANPGYTILYTLDSSVPTASSNTYTQPLMITDASVNENVFSAITNIVPANTAFTPPDVLVDKATIVRAVAMDSYGNTSAVVTASYFVGFQDREGFQNIRIISLVVDPDDMFGCEYGIYVTGAGYDAAAREIIGANAYNEELELDEAGSLVFRLNPLDPRMVHPTANFFQRGRDWERNLHMEVFTNGHELLFSQASGIRIAGNSSRLLPQKQLRVYSRRIYSGRGRFEYSLLSNGYRNTTVLAPANNIRRFFVGSLFSGRAVSVQNYTIYQVFLNGEYWGTYNAMDRFNADFIELNYGVSRDNLLIVRGRDELLDGDSIAPWAELLRFIENTDLSIPENYDSVVQLIDIQSFIDLIGTVLYTADFDTRFFGENIFWRAIETCYSNRFADGRWRTMAHDNDAGARHHHLDLFTYYTSWWRGVSFMDDPVIVSLLENIVFRELFVLSYMDMANYTFDPARVSALLGEVYAEYSIALSLNYRRWRGRQLSSTIRDVQTFFDNRFDYAVGHLAEHMELSGSLVNLTIAAYEAGDITLNTITPELIEGYGYRRFWDGRYFTDFPVVVTANPSPGYRFVRWQMENATALDPVTDSTIRVRLGGDSVITAVFEPEV